MTPRMIKDFTAGKFILVKAWLTYKFTKNRNQKKGPGGNKELIIKSKENPDDCLMCGS